MARIDFSIKVEGETQLKRGFNRVVEAVSNFRPYFQSIKPEIFRIEREIFESEGAASGSRWQPLTPAYKAIKATEYGNKKILQASGEMMRSLTSDTPDTIYRTDKDTLEFGSSLQQFRAHQLGKGNNPQRPPVRFSDAHKRRIGDKMRGSLLYVIKRSGFEVNG